MIKQPPYTNGIMVLSNQESEVIRIRMNAIITAFDPTDEQPVCDTFYIVSTYNQQNPGDPINGDTAEFILK